VVEEMRLLQPSASVQVSKKNPDRFVKRAAKIIRTGFGQPSIFNADLIVQELVRQGKTVAELGNRNRPIDMIVYEKDGKEFLLIANNSRFLILPWVRVPQLASQVLSLAVDQVRRDWPHQFDTPLWLLET
jgi:hypothetical protein